MRLLCGYCVVIVRLLCGASGEAIMGRRKAPKGRPEEAMGRGRNRYGTAQSA